MLKLNDSKWGELKDAYGPALDIPRLLQDIPEHLDPKKASTDEPWFSLWSALCHQGDVYSASYAAVIYLVQFVSIYHISGTTLAWDFFLLPASIEAARLMGRGPEVPKEFSKEYHEAIAKLGDYALKYENASDENLSRSARYAHLVAIGDIKTAEKLIEE